MPTKIWLPGAKSVDELGSLVGKQVKMAYFGKFSGVEFHVEAKVEYVRSSHFGVVVGCLITGANGCETFFQELVGTFSCIEIIDE